MIPLINVLAFSLSSERFASPERREPNTRAALARVSSRVEVVFGDEAGGEVEQVEEGGEIDVVGIS
jgi:LytS/YehU family sensor histidine kinase